jgi:hypothetical protein
MVSDRSVEPRDHDDASGGGAESASPGFLANLWRNHKKTIIVGIIVYLVAMLAILLVSRGSSDLPFEYDVF